MPYEMPPDILWQGGDFLGEFLHAALTEYPLAGLVGLHYRCCRVEFRHGHKLHPLRG